MIGTAIRPPLRHRVVLERNVETGISATRSPLPPRFEPVATSMPAHYWEPERAVDAARTGLREGPNVIAVALGPRLLVRREADVRIEDRVTQVRWAGGSEVITAQPMRVVEVLWRQSHTDVGLELITPGPLVEGS